eukprot:sb/3478753/
MCVRTCNLGDIDTWCDRTRWLCRQRATRARWKMFGHILRSQINAPVMMALKFAVSCDMRGRRGRHQTNLFSVLNCDLRERGFDLCYKHADLGDDDQLKR